MSKKKKSGLRFFLVVGILGAAGLVWAQQSGLIFAPDDGPEIEGAPVRRGPLEITVTERGNLTAKTSIRMKSEVEGRSTILYLIPEGTRVKEGDLVAELDSSDLVDRRVAQEISVESARAAATKAREGLEIQKIENESLIARAKQDVAFARIDLEKFRGENPSLTAEQLEEITRLLEEAEESVEADSAAPPEEVAGDPQEDDGFVWGDQRQQYLQAVEAIQVALEERKRAEETLNWSKQLFDRGFVALTELEADELTAKRADVKLDQAHRALYQLAAYEHPKELARLEGALEEAIRQLEKAKKQAVAQIADYEAGLNSANVKLELEEQKLTKLNEQISKAKILAPGAGMIVYGRTEGHRWGGGEPVQEGGEVRERQEIASIPGSGAMIAQASIHESVLKQVTKGLPVIVRIDAMPGNEFHGEVALVAQLPDPNSWFANPNQRLYRTEILIEESDPEMRPGMSCSIEILVESVRDALYVPAQAVYFSGGRQLAWVRNGNEIEERTVELGPHSEKWVVVESGVREGEIVLLSPPPGFQPEESEGQNGEEGQPAWRSRPEGSQRPSGAGAPGAGAPGAVGPGAGAPGAVGPGAGGESRRGRGGGERAPGAGERRGGTGPGQPGAEGRRSRPEGSGRPNRDPGSAPRGGRGEG